ncbi:succinate dehydrogenase / fumarate reductase membrane anchor subunit [Oxalobacteraceae bacterium GrIS 2.11]|uniref:succinate dehydrogenase, hydrophobic membrane anchor protein n=1 Tax=Undibacterium sp. GrIS 1.8 TaxID=3143934 RepID=UPI0033930E5D
MRRAVSGLRAWLVQRVTAVYMLMFLVFLLAHFLFDRPSSYLAWHAWIVSPVISIAAFVFCAALLAHMWVGLRDVILDYVKPLAVRVGTLALLALGLIGLGAWVIRILWQANG